MDPGLNSGGCYHKFVIGFQGYVISITKYKISIYYDVIFMKEYLFQRVLFAYCDYDAFAGVKNDLSYLTFFLECDGTHFFTTSEIRELN